jgi:spore coat polysaccharide biosynthesis predicted glycosyltransferase SpsG
MKIAFFTEAGSERGMGHLIRCQTIANQFEQNNIEINIFLDSDINYDYKFKNLTYFKWEELNINIHYDVIFIDSYEATEDIYNTLQKKTNLGIYIDDFERIDYPKGIIINFAPDSKELFFKNRNKDNEYLLGLDYIPIRKEFLKYKNLKKEKKLFIMLGGSDTANLSLNIIEALKDIDIKKVIVSNNEITSNKLSKYDNVKVLFQSNDDELIKEMATSSYAISTASMSLYELSFLQIPTIIIAVSQNQITGVSQMLKNKLAISYIDIMLLNWEKNISFQLKNLMEHKQIVDNQIDGLGVKRIYEYIIKRLER